MKYSIYKKGTNNKNIYFINAENGILLLKRDTTRYEKTEIIYIVKQLKSKKKEQTNEFPFANSTS